MGIDVGRAVGDLAAERLARATVFDRFGIDYCCYGHVPLDEACRRKGLTLREVVVEIAAVDEAPPDSGEPDYATMSPGDLADLIEATHHAFMRRELPRLGLLLERVVSAHTDHHLELLEIAAVFADFRDEIESHLLKEERVLFPIIRQLEAATSLPSLHCGSVRNPIRAMEHEHDSAGTALNRMRELTRGYATPDDACTSYRSLMEGLAAVEPDLHRHIHKENNILFPKAAELEAILARP